MALSTDLISQFVKVTTEKPKTKKEETVYGTIVVDGKSKYVKIDGSDLLTPVSSTADTNNGERVTVLIKNHSAIVTGNMSSPAARVDDLGAIPDIGNKIDEFEILLADKVSTKEFDAQTGRIDQLVTEDTLVKGRLTANEANISKLQADDVDIKGSLNAATADIEKLKTGKLDANAADIKYATIENLKATNAGINNLEATYGKFEVATTNKFAATDATIKNLGVKYANIDFSNIGKAALEEFFSKSGLIEDVVIGNATISGKLVGVTISGDLIEGNTIVADKLVMKGTDGMYYKLNTDGMKIEAQQTDYNSLNGQVIKAKTITASKISVNDLVAFGATIGGFKITNSSLYSGVKTSVDNTTNGIFLGDDGQMAIGGMTSFLKFYKDPTGAYKLDISADSLTFGDNQIDIGDIGNTVSDLETAVKSISGKTAYITLSKDSDGLPLIELGKTDSPFKVRITNTSIDFMEGSSKIAYVNNNSLYIERAIIKDKLQVSEGSNFVWKNEVTEIWA